MVTQSIKLFLGEKILWRSTNDEKLETITEYIKNNQKSFYRLAYSYVKNNDEALDIVQEAILKALSKGKSLKDVEYIKTWFYRILVNESLMYIRKYKKGIVTDIDIESISYEDEDIALSIDLYNAVQRLESKLRIIIILRYFEDMKLEDIASITDTNLSTVKSRLYKGLGLLKQWISEE